MSVWNSASVGFLQIAILTLFLLCCGLTEAGVVRVISAATPICTVLKRSDEVFDTRERHLVVCLSLYQPLNIPPRRPRICTITFTNPPSLLLAHFPVFPPNHLSLLILSFKVQTTKKPTSHLAGKSHKITKMSSTADIHGTPVRNGHNGHHHNRNRSRSRSNRNSRTLYHEKHQRSHLSDFQKHLVAASGEFAGTFLFLYFAYAGNIVAVLQEPMAARDGSLANSTLMYIAMAYGFSLLVNVWAFFRISGGLFNPAVS